MPKSGESPADDSKNQLPVNALAQAARAAAGNSEPQSRDSKSSQVPTLNVPDQDQEDDEAPPPYGENYGEVFEENTQLGVDTKATVTDDGRVDININQRTSRLSNLLAPALRNQLRLQDEPAPPPYIPASLGGEPGQPPPPPLNVVIHVVGSRGDVQPFIALGKVLKDRYGHRVRLATHPVFKQFVTENGLEFFSIGGDPAELMAFMVKHPGLMPGFDAMRSGDIGTRRKEIGQMVKGCWRSCIEAGDGSTVEVKGDTQEEWMSSDFHTGSNRHTKPSDLPFVCDAIIANPPSFAHIHCAEKLGCPLHMMFTMPYSPTQAFPHPLANIQSSNADTNMTNYLSYAMVEALTWQGLGDVINRFRHNSLGLEPISLMWAPGMLARLRVPYTYCFSPSLIQKPKDWGTHISLSGFYFLSLASNFTPDPELKAFLDAGPPPVYIGFGSIVVDDPTAMTKMIFEAVKKTGQRALVSKGWGGIGADELGIPDSVMMLGNVPHDWLFKHVSCVVHHGGAGTTAAGIACAKPTVIVPFFGDQGWWAAMVAKAGAGPEPIPYKNLDADKLAASITSALSPETRERAQELADGIAHEKGTESGCQSFHQFLEVDKLRCTIAPSRAAVWRLKRTNVKFSALAATVLGNEGLLDFKDLKLYRAREYETDDGPWDPITGGGAAIIGTASSVMMGVADFPIEALKALKIHPDSRKKKKASKDNGNQSPEQSMLDSPSSNDRPSVDRDSSDEMLTPQASASGASSPQSSGGSQFNVSESLARLDSGKSESTDGAKSQKKGSALSSMGNALREQFNDQMNQKRSAANQRRPSGSGAESSSKGQPSSGEASDPVASAINTGKGISRIAGSLTKSPMDFTLGLAKGFRNAPKLYGDDTVRKAEPVTDFKSGVRAATKEFGYGMFDGITGLVTQPMEGAKKEGAAGFIKGMGKGFGGIVFKPGAAFWGIPGYMMKGIYQELQAMNGSSIQNYIIAARTAQGYADWHIAHPQERADIIEKWISLKGEIQKKKNPDEALHDWALGQVDKRQAWQAEQKKKIKDQLKSPSFRNLLRRNKSTDPSSSTTSPAAARSPNTNPSATGGQTSERQQSANITSDDAELEEAIRQSVAASSEGNAEEDTMIERALQASIRELRAQQPPRYNDQESEDEESEAIRNAMAASIIEAEHHNSRTQSGQRNDEEENDEDMERAIKESLAHSNNQNSTGDSGPESDQWNEADISSALSLSKHPAMRSAFDINAAAQAAGDDQIIRETAQRKESGHPGAVTEDETVEPALPSKGKTVPAVEEQSAVAITAEETGEEGEGDEEMARALKESLAAHRDEQGRVDEEKVVMEYIKKQSMLEEEHRRKAQAQGGSQGNKPVEAESSRSGAQEQGQGSGGDVDDEELKRAIALSMDHQRGA